MHKQNKISWKSKIDPHFDKVVRGYVKFLDERGQGPREGRLNFPEELTGHLADDPAWQSLDEPDYNLDMFRFAKNTGLIDEEGFRNISGFINSTMDEDADKTLKLSLKILEALPEEESRAFYRKELESFTVNNDGDSMDFFSLTLQLFMRYLSVKFESDGTEAKQVDVDTEYIRKSNVSSSLINVMSFISSSLAHQKTLLILAEGIRKGDDESLFKALTTNKSLLYTEEVKGRFIKAQLTGDTDFFKGLAKAIEANPLQKIGQHGKTYSVLTLFWYMGLHKLTVEELHDFLTHCGLVPPSYPEAFYKFLERHINPLLEA